jgi:hypothetical protein
MVVDPFDLELVLAPPLVGLTAAERAARRVHKVRYPVRVTCDSFVVDGWIHMFPGNAPEFATHRGGPLFLPLTEASVWRNGRFASSSGADAVLVNRHSIRRISQLEPVH